MNELKGKMKPHSAFMGILIILAIIGSGVTAPPLRLFIDTFEAFAQDLAPHIVDTGNSTSTPNISLQSNIKTKSGYGSLLIAYPTGNDTLRLVFSEPLRADTAEQAGNYFTKSGLKILSAFLDQDPKVVTLIVMQA